MMDVNQQSQMHNIVLVEPLPVFIGARKLQNANAPTKSNESDFYFNFSFHLKKHYTTSTTITHNYHYHPQLLPPTTSTTINQYFSY